MFWVCFCYLLPHRCPPLHDLTSASIVIVCLGLYVFYLPRPAAALRRLPAHLFPPMCCCWLVAALGFAVEAQQELLEQDWPPELLRNEVRRGRGVKTNW